MEKLSAFSYQLSAFFVFRFSFSVRFSKDKLANEKIPLTGF